MNDNTDLLLEAIEHPERFSDDELSKLLQDPDTRELYLILTKTVDAIAEPPVIDIDHEWKEFDNKYHPISGHNILKKLHMRLFMRHAAAGIAILIVASIAVVAATVGITRRSSRTDTVARETPINQSTSTIPLSDTVTKADLPIADPVTITFKDDKFKSIIDVICRYYGASAQFREPSLKDLHLYYRWDQSLPLEDVVKELNNFEQINITLADSVLLIAK
ncbi:MAG: DUF4974 domain-containing protein [Bacteroides sp.]|nr:DUF4974 domain-containing protein [Bacteroides sp.]